MRDTCKLDLCERASHVDAPTEKGAVFIRQLLFSCNISYADYAIAMVDEIEKGHHINQRISVVGA